MHVLNSNSWNDCKCSRQKMVSRSFSCFEVWMPRLFKIRYPPPQKEREQHYCKKSFNLLNTSTPGNGSLSIGCGHHASWKLRPGTNRSNNEVFELMIFDCGWVSTTEIWWISWISESIFPIFWFKKTNSLINSLASISRNSVIQRLFFFGD